MESENILLHRFTLINKVRKMKKDELIFYVLAAVVVIVLILGGMYVLRFFNAATLHTQVINPKPGVECVVVSANESTSVDCWKAL